MDKIRTVLVIMLFFGAALAGCTGEEIEKVEFDWLASFKSILKNLVDIVSLLIKWR